MRGMEKTKPVPAAALRFDTAAPLALTAAETADSPRTFAGVAYSGDVIRNHFYWGHVVFDLASTTAPDKVPVLVEHARAQRAGVGQIAIGQDIRITGSLLANTHGQNVAADADAGFPWQLSVHIEPGSVEEVATGVAASVNGRDFTGPLTIFRNSLIRETSFTPTGADSHTSARVFSGAPELHIPVFSTEDRTMSDQQDPRIAALETDLAAANARAEAAEQALAGIKASAREADIRTMFAAMGREYSAEAAKPYFQIDDAAFAVVMADMKAAAPKHSPHLFHDTATSGAPAKNHATLDHTAIFAARKSASKGN